RVSGGAGTASFYAKLRLADGSYQAFAVTLWTSPGAPVVYGSVKPASDPSTELKVDIFRTIIENIPIVVWATNEEGIFTYHDGKGLEAANLAPGTFVGHNVFQLFTDPVTTGNMKTAYGGESTHVVADIQDIVWESWCLPIRGAGGKVRGVVGASLNITEAKRIEQELRAKLDLIEKQQRVIRSLATPIIQVWDEVLTMPMVGMVDSMRASEVMDTLLQEVSKTRARFAIIDITGVEVMDTATVSHILRLMHAIQLLGAEGIITGIHPAIAQIIVGLGVDLAGIKTLGSLRDGLRYCMARMQSNGPARERSDARPRSVR
ncbi:MAG: STAS domain-containing protein, partial [Polyangiaceae bacterium]|nr:STAS domain-containing protein [Polyangiaceae bacterium]